MASYPLFNQNCNVVFGGSEVQIFNYSQKLADDTKYKIFVITGNYGQNKKEIFNKVNLIRGYSLERTFINYLTAPLNLIYNLFKIKPNVIICRGFGPEVGVSAIYKLLFRKKMIYMIAHDNDVKGQYFKGFLGKIFRFGFKNSDFIISQNNYQYIMYKKRFNKTNIKTIQNSFTINRNVNFKKKYILWVSRADHWKNPDIILKLSNDFKNEKFVIIMNKGSDLKTWQKYSMLYKKQDNITFVESVPFNKIQEYFNNAKIFVNTSKSEGFPNTFIQACLAQTPILSYNVNPNKIFDKYDIGYCANGSYTSMKKQLSSMLNNKSIWQKKKNNTYNYVNQNHNIETNLTHLKDIINNILS